MQSTERLGNIIKEVPVVAFRRSPNLRDLLVRRKNRKQRQHTQAPSRHIPLQLQTWLAASPALTLTMGKHRTLSQTQEKQDKFNITLLLTQQT